MNIEQQQYIKQNTDLIKHGEWKQFFVNAPGGIGGVLYEAGIDFMEELEQVPACCFLSSSLTKITIPDGITSIGNYAFANCKWLKSITIPESVTIIGKDAFYSCSSLSNVTMGNSVTSIGSSAFSGCSSLTSITIPESVTSIGEYAFYRCDSLTNITIPNSVTSIGYHAFAGCSSLTSIVILNSIISIGERAFSNLGSDVVINFSGTKEQWKKICNSDRFKNTYFTVNCSNGTLHKKKR